MSNPPAGWHPSPGEPGQQRYWDGEQWTEHVAPAAEATMVSTAISSPEPVKSRGGNKLLIGGIAALVLVLLVAVIAVAVLAGSDDGDEDVVTGQSTEIAQSTEPPTTAALTTEPATTEPRTTEPRTTVPRTTTPPTTAKPPSSPASLKLGDTASYDSGATIQVISYEQPVPPSSEYNGPDEGMEFGVADIEVCAGSEEVSYNPFAVEAQTPDNRRYPSAFGDAKSPRLDSGDLPAEGGCVRGYVTLALPVGQKPAFIVWDYYGWELTRWKIG